MPECKWHLSSVLLSSLCWKSPVGPCFLLRQSGARTLTRSPLVFAVRIGTAAFALAKTTDTKLTTHSATLGTPTVRQLPEYS
jgi:hypothetical protein